MLFLKNIIIVGPSRAGKTTLARKLNEELNYIVISLDQLVAVFQGAYPQLEIRLNWDRDRTTDHLAPFEPAGTRCCRQSVSAGGCVF